MPPHGRGEPTVQTVGLGVRAQTHGPGPTLQAVPSDDEQPRQAVRGPRRRTKSAAYGTLETIMSSSRSSDEDKSKKKPAAVIAEDVRGRAAKKELQSSEEGRAEVATEPGPTEQRPTKHVRSKSASFAAVIIDNAQGSKSDTPSQVFSPTSLVSEPARPQTSTATMLETSSGVEPQYTSPTLQSMLSTKPALIRNESTVSAKWPNQEGQSSVLSNLTSWLPWGKSSSSQRPVVAGRMRSASHAEGSLRELLKTTDIDKKGKSIDRSG